MRRGPGRIGAAYLLVGLLAIGTLWQLLTWTGSKEEKGDAVRLLYQVSLFQMEWLGSYMNDAGGVKSTDQLDSLKQAAYSAGYTHERLTLAVGGGRLAKLSSVDELLQYILRLQIGGARPLKPEEAETLQQASKTYRKLFEDYGKLLTAGGELIESQSTKVSKADKEIAELLRKKLK